jgi:hypothetical protein
MPARFGNCACRLVLPFATIEAGLYLPSIPKGDISITLDPIATGLGAPLYGISPPARPRGMFVLEQAGR